MTDSDRAPSPSRQPPGLYLLFGVEMWERFSYYGMRAFLTLFLISTAGGFGWSKADASHLYGWYTGLVYLTPLLGGYLADRVMGTHRAIVLGSLIIASGHFCLAVPSRPTFFLGLALIILGTGFHKSNISTMVGQLFKQGDSRRDRAFTIFYMGINLGALLGPWVCGSLAESVRFGWHWGFAAAGVGMVIGTITYVVLKRRLLGDIGDVPAARREPAAGAREARGPLTREEKDRIAAIAILAFFNIFFWCAFEQAGSSMNFFAFERTDRMIFGLFEFKTSWFQAVNPACILIFGPLFALLWKRLADHGREPSTPVKFVLALVLMAAGFAILVVGARISDTGVKAHYLFLFAAYAFHTWGELCLSPVGLSMVTKLAPARFASLLMGIWFLSFFASDLLAGRLAGMVEQVEKGEVFRLLGGQADFFLIFVIVPLVGAALLLPLVRTLNRLMHGRA
jgi:POT family proton-dependent oligopeptide transporter